MVKVAAAPAKVAPETHPAEAPAEAHAKAPAKAPARVAKAAKAPAKAPPPPVHVEAPPPPRLRLPLGVYLTRHREVAVAIRHTPNGIWYLTTLSGKVTVEHAGDDKFLHDFPLTLREYPMLKAIRKINDNGLPRDEHTQKVLDRLLQSL